MILLHFLPVSDADLEPDNAVLELAYAVLVSVYAVLVLDNAILEFLAYAVLECFYPDDAVLESSFLRSFGVVFFSLRNFGVFSLRNFGVFLYQLTQFWSLVFQNCDSQ